MRNNNKLKQKSGVVGMRWSHKKDADFSELTDEQKSKIIENYVKVAGNSINIISSSTKVRQDKLFESLFGNTTFSSTKVQTGPVVNPGNTTGMPNGIITPSSHTTTLKYRDNGITVSPVRK
jgi:hypothetical protein